MRVFLRCTTSIHTNVYLLFSCLLFFFFLVWGEFIGRLVRWDWRGSMRRRFVLPHMAATAPRNAPSVRGVVLRRTLALLSTSDTRERQQKMLRGLSDGGVHPGDGFETAGQLAGEVKATRDEARRMAEHTRQSCGVRPPVTAEKDWAEPALEDLDRSIPQVDCAFIADLIRARTARRTKFLQKKSEVRAKVASLSKQRAASVLEAANFPLLRAGRGGSNSDTITDDKNSSNNDNSGDHDDDFVAASPEVLAQLTDSERDTLLTSRPEYDDGFVLLDCRTVNEVTSWGMIEGAKLLPAHEMFDGFHLTPEEFEVEFGFAKPRPEEKIICYCQYGPRSLMAAQILSWMGYMNVLHFRDGYYEWGKQYNLLLRRWMLHDKESGNEIKRQVAFQAGLELQREIAAEFNELPMKEAARYKIDTTRSRGKMLVGEGVRERAYDRLSELVGDMQPTLLPGVLDDSDRGAGGEREEYLQRFLKEATGVDTRDVDTRPPMGLAEAQGKIVDAFTRRDGSSYTHQR